MCFYTLSTQYSLQETSTMNSRGFKTLTHQILHGVSQPGSCYIMYIGLAQTINGISVYVYIRRLNRIYTVHSRRRLKICLDRHATFLGWTPLTHHPPPNPPFWCPHPNKKGTNLPLFQLGIHLHIHQDLKQKCCRVMGQKLRYRRPCTRDLPGTHNWLAQSHIASISSEFH